MKHMVTVSWGLMALTNRVVAELREVVQSAGDDPPFRSIRRPAGDPVLDHIVAILKTAGTTMCSPNREAQRNEFRVIHTREWEPADADIADYLWLRVKEPSIEVFTEDDDPRAFCFEAKDLPRARSSLGGNGFHVFCSEHVQARLVAVEFAHLQLRPLKAMRQVEGPPFFVPVENGPRWWQLLSDLTLPPFAPSIVKKKLRDDTIIPRDYAGSVSCSEPPFRDFQPAYLKSEWSNVPHFDVAQTFEHNINPPDLCSWLIVSKRFYQFCKQQRLNADWVPVRFEDG